MRLCSLPLIGCLITIILLLNLTSVSSTSSTIYSVDLPSLSDKLQFRKVSWITSSDHPNGIKFSAKQILIDPDIPKAMFLREKIKSSRKKDFSIKTTIQKGLVTISSGIKSNRYVGLFRDRNWQEIASRTNDKLKCQFKGDKGDLLLIINDSSQTFNLEENLRSFNDESDALNDLRILLPEDSVKAVIISIGSESDQDSNIIANLDLSHYFCAQKWFKQPETPLVRWKVENLSNPPLSNRMCFEYLGFPPMLNQSAVTLSSQRFFIRLMTNQVEIVEVPQTDSSSSLRLLLENNQVSVLSQGLVPFTVAVFRNNQMENYSIPGLINHSIPVKLDDIIVVLPHSLTWTGNKSFRISQPGRPKSFFSFEKRQLEILGLFNGQQALFIQIQEQGEPFSFANLPLKSLISRKSSKNLKTIKKKNTTPTKNDELSRIYWQNLPIISTGFCIEEIMWGTFEKEFPKGILFNERMIFFGEAFKNMPTAYLAHGMETTISGCFQNAEKWGLKVHLENNQVGINSKFCSFKAYLVRGDERQDYSRKIDSQGSLVLEVSKENQIEIIPFLVEYPLKTYKKEARLPKAVLKRAAMQYRMKPVTGIAIKINFVDKLPSNVTNKKSSTVGLINDNLILKNWFEYPDDQAEIFEERDKCPNIAPSELIFQWTNDESVANMNVKARFALFGVSLGRTFFKISSHLRSRKIVENLTLREMALEIKANVLSAQVQGTVPFRFFVLRNEKVVHNYWIGRSSQDDFPLAKDDTLVIFPETLQGKRNTVDSFGLVRDKKELLNKLSNFSRSPYFVAKVVEAFKGERRKTAPLLNIQMKHKPQLRIRGLDEDGEDI